MTLTHLARVSRFARLWLMIAAVVAAVSAAVMMHAPAMAMRPVPTLSGPVVDEASLLTASDRTRLEELAREARAQLAGQGPQLQFLIVPTLEGESIEDFSIRAAETWQIGSRGKDNGLLVVVARDERQVRIEVGGGIEGEITDAQAGRIIRETIAPAFRSGRFGEGLYDAGVALLDAVGATPPTIAERRHQSPAPGATQRAPQRRPSVLAITLGLLALILLLTRISGGRGGRGGRGRMGPFWLGGLGGFGGLGGWGSWGGGGWGGRGRSGGLGGNGGWGRRGGGGGGWRGGGGGFSGGGASGGW